MNERIKSPKSIANIRESGKYLTELLHFLQDSTKAGIDLISIEALAEDRINKHHLKGAFKGYEGFPANLCLSINDCVVHGIPDHTILKNGDLLKIDAGIIYQRAFSDAAISLIIGNESHNPEGQKLIKSTKAALDRGVENIKIGGTAYEFAKAVYDQVKGDGFEIIRTLSGHGVGNTIHEQPHIHNYPHAPMKKIKWLPGMVVALEPITAIKSDDVVYRNSNNRNLYCRKGDLGAQREYTVLITENGPEILAGIQ